MCVELCRDGAVFARSWLRVSQPKDSAVSCGAALVWSGHQGAPAFWGQHKASNIEFDLHGIWAREISGPYSLLSVLAERLVLAHWFARWPADNVTQLVELDEIVCLTPQFI